MCFLQVHFSVAISLLVLSLLVQISGFRLRAWGLDEEAAAFSKALAFSVLTFEAFLRSL